MSSVYIERHLSPLKIQYIHSLLELKQAVDGSRVEILTPYFTDSLLSKSLNFYESQEVCRTS
jgi:hypothetical protein